MANKVHTVAVIGGGPRGLAALESLYERVAMKGAAFTVKTVLFEPHESTGSGPVYAPDQSSGNWLNIPERLVDIPARPDLAMPEGTVPGFLSYSQWRESALDDCSSEEVDHYPQRAKLGRYLHARFSSLSEVLEKHGLLTVVHSLAEEIRFHARQVTIITSDGQSRPADEVVLTLGHQPVQPDQSMQKWSTFADSHPCLTLIGSPYPTASITQRATIDSASNVAIRGFGLAMIDVVKGLTEARGGRFVLTDERTRKMSYEASGREPHSMVPFSLDGLPLVPKPLNASIDAQFEPPLAQKQRFENVCRRLAANQGNESDPLSELVDIVSDIQVSLFLSLGSSVVAHSLPSDQLLAVSRQWLADSEFEHDLVISPQLPARQAIQKYTRMACQLEPFSLDYCLGQLWRHLQSIMFKHLAYTSMPAEAIGNMINLHERMKRYAFGPPVDSMQRLIALSEHGLLSYRVVEDPDIELTSDGWVFRAENDSYCADTMIDSVLASPNLEQVSSALICQLRQENRLISVADSLGALTTRDGLAVQGEHEDYTPVAMLGRLAKGSLFEADSLTECFGEHQSAWAEGVLDRLASRES